MVLLRLLWLSTSTCGDDDWNTRPRAFPRPTLPERESLALDVESCAQTQHVSIPTIPLVARAARANPAENADTSWSSSRRPGSCSNADARAADRASAPRNLIIPAEVGLATSRGIGGMV